MMKPGKPISCLSLEMQTLHDVFMAGHGISRKFYVMKTVYIKKFYNCVYVIFKVSYMFLWHEI